MRPIAVCLCLIGGCLAGCTITPTPAAQLFGVSNPTMTMDVPGYGKLRVPTNAKLKLKLDKSPDGTVHVDMNLASNAAEVVDAEGDRLKKMEGTRAAEFAAILEAKKLEYEFWAKVMPEVLGLFRSLIPIPATGALGDGPGSATTP